MVNALRLLFSTNFILFRLFPPTGMKKYVMMTAEVLFMVSTFYYIINLLAVLKKDGKTEFCNNKWNLADCLTVALSLLAIGLYVCKTYLVCIGLLPSSIYSWLIKLLFLLHPNLRI